MDNIKEKILFVDDSVTVRKAAIKILSERYDVIEAVDGEDAWEKLQQDNEIRIIFADIQMPKLNGMQLLGRIKNSEDDHFNCLPVIMITGESDSEATMRAVFEMGATDFIGKPFKAIDLLTRAHSYLKISAKFRKLNQLSGIDRLTGLFNASHYKKLGEQMFSLAVRSNIDMTVAYLEIADYQKIILSYGESTASQVLTTIASRINALLRKEDVIARLGVARFALILPSTTRIKASTVITRISDTIHNLAFDTGIRTIHAKIAVGIATSLEDQASSFDEVSLQAEYALMNASTNRNATATRRAADSVSQQLPEATNKDHLLQSFLHMIEGNYNKITDSHLREILDRCNNFAEFIEQYRPELPVATAGDANQ